MMASVWGRRTRTSWCIVFALSLPALAHSEENTAPECISSELRSELIEGSPGDETVATRYQRARSYYEANRWAEAAVLFGEIALSHGAHEVAPYAARLHLDSLNAMMRDDETRATACRAGFARSLEALLASEELMRNDELRADLAALRCGVLRHQAEELTNAMRFDDAARLYEQIYDVHREECRRVSPNEICEALYNAALNFEAGFRIESANTLRRRLVIECGPGSDHGAGRLGEASVLVTKALHQIGSSHHALVDFEKAASAYEDFARRYPGEVEAPPALWNAAIFRTALNQHEKALNDVRLFERNYGRRRAFKARVIALVHRVGESEVKRGRWKAAEREADSFLRRYGRAASGEEAVGARVNLAYALIKQGRRHRKRAGTELRRALEIVDRGRTPGESPARRMERYRAQMRPVGTSDGERNADSHARLVRFAHAAGKARFLLGELAYERLREKREISRRAIEHYESAIEEGVPEWEVAGHARLGDIHSMLVISPQSGSASSEAGTESSRAKRRAIESYERCRKRATVLKVGLERLRHCEQRLVDLGERSQGPPDEFWAFPDAIGSHLALPDMIPTDPRSSRDILD